MCDYENNFNPISIEPCHQEYFEHLFNSKINKSEGITHLNQQQYGKVLKALDKAHEIRKFEIEMYWKRANYFWAFIAIVATAYGAYFYSDKSNSDILPLLFLSTLGFILSLCFRASIISSKSWQNNWEKSVDILEYYVTGNIYKININDDNLHKYSVSEINKFVSSTICFSWCFAFIYPVIKKSILITNIVDHYLTGTIAPIIILLCIWLFTFIMIRKPKKEKGVDEMTLRHVKIKNANKHS